MARDPHFLVSVRLAASKKMIDLPSDRARWGWVCLLGEAKLGKPAGTFPSMKVLKDRAGRFRDCVDLYVTGRLLEAAGAMCDRCKAYFPVIASDAVVVHDWKEHQDKVTRTQDWRERVGVESGHVNALPDGSSFVSPVVSLTGAGAGGSASPSQSGTSSPSSEETRDSLDRFYELTHFRPWGVWSGDELRAAEQEYGVPTVIAALEAEAPSGDRKDLVKRALARLAREAEHAKRAAPPRPKSARKPEDAAAVRRELMSLYAKETA